MTSSIKDKLNSHDYGIWKEQASLEGQADHSWSKYLDKVKMWWTAFHKLQSSIKLKNEESWWKKQRLIWGLEQGSNDLNAKKIYFMKRIKCIR